ncbi:RNA polymerase sigma-70 factor [Chitinophaga sp. GCM10012297]|uniref:RNA polymerase sigma factor n=1 Tax=Chitinophaga chungangae TaxID=2821488 RepID=A0ABS3YB30_9BACT|nr:RNA polymerase sigma-70 factor [Chitinophaga chungangae]MBO9151359.1 RNA polymerase sigma-70 factor [Chitinophaga chungangae]
MADYQTYNDNALLLRIAEGDEAAFSLLFNRYYQAMVSFVQRFTESAPVSEEIVQDVFLKIWMTRETLAAVTHCKAYLMTVAKNQTINALKKLAREQEKAREIQEAPQLQQETEDDPRFHVIDRAIDQLPPQRKTVYLMARHGRLSYEEIGRQLNISAKTVKKHMQLAIASVTAFIKANARLLLAFLFWLKFFSGALLFF